MTRKPRDTSWQGARKQYNKIVGEKGHYYHQQVVLPGVMRMLHLEGSPDPRLLDLACGQGVLSRRLPDDCGYVGVDAAKGLIAEAKKASRNKKHLFLEGDICEKLPFKDRNFSHVAIVLALQNLADPQATLKSAAEHLREGGRIVIVLNHPCFRIPRQTAWGEDDQAKIQYRRVNRYMSSMEIPIQMQPSQGEKSVNTVSYHHPLSAIIGWMVEAGFAIDGLEEWCSDKKSSGGKARMENRAREEIPLFMAISGVKAR